MDIDISDLVAVLDRIGVVAFAFSGVDVGRRRGMDAFGLLAIGMVTAIGGGITRDVLLVRLPLAIDQADYLLWAAGAAAIAIAVTWRPRPLPRDAILGADAAGLGAFAVAGSLAGIQAGVPMPAVIVLAIVTATGGGVIRDLLADRVPIVLRSELNATSAAAGGLAVWALEPVSLGLASVAGVVVATGLRIGSLVLGIRLPAPPAEGEGLD